MDQDGHNIWFSTTQWTVVLSAGQQQASEALEALCCRYWYPIYAYVRRKGLAPEDAKDATQGFFFSLLQRQSLKNVQKHKGRFRSFLMGAVNHYLSDEHAKAMTQKRGGGRALIELDALDVEERYQCEPTTMTNPERLFDRRWAMTILGQAMERLERDYKTTNRAEVFESLQGFLTTDSPTGGYWDIATGLNMTESAVKTAVHRMRKRYREFCREEVAQTVVEPSEVEAELQYLCEILCDDGTASS